MSDFLISVVAGAVAGSLACLVMLRFNRAPAPRPAAPPAEPAPAPPVPNPAPAASVDAVPLGEISTLLPVLNQALSPLAEEIDHPRVLPGMPEFQAVVAAFRRPDATFTMLSQYALGGNWPFACAAFIVLAEHPQRETLRDPVLRHLENTRPYVLMYAFRYLTSLEQRPPIGAVVLAVPEWWQNNPVIPGMIHDYFARSAELGDPPGFGDLLDNRAELATAQINGLLQKIQHPSAQRLMEAIRRWEDHRIDRNFLRTVGTLWEADDSDPLLISPPAWEELLASAETSIRQNRPRSVLVSGDPRTGKSAFIKLLGARMQAAGWTMFSASGNELMADQIYIGQLEGRIRKVVEALHSRRKLIWYVRDLGQIANSGTHQGQSASILDQILPAVAAGDLIIVGETSQAAATRLFQSRPSLRSMMEALSLQPMSEDETLALAGQVAERITAHAGVSVSQEAVTATMELAQQYLGSGQLPGVVLELLKRAASRSINADETALTAASVIATLSQISGLPSVILDTSQRVELAQMQNFFAARVIGQAEAVKAVVDRIAMLKAGLTDPSRPIGVFLFAGPTGTGKTELAKTLADFLFGAASRMTRLDMSEFQTPESTSKIVGQRGDAPADSLIDRVRKQPFSVVLLDEFEKAHPNCWDLFLQIFDDGRLSDANGREADFRHCFIILTSNLGATTHRGGSFGFRSEGAVYADDQVVRAIGQTFRPEFVNRLDKIIVFQPLSRDLMRSILHKELAGILERRGLRQRTWAVEWEPSAIEFLLDRGFSPEMGARPLKRAIDQHLLAPLAATLVEHRFPEGDQFLFVRANGSAIEVEFVDPDAEPVQTDAPEADGNLSLPSIVWRQTGSAAERASLSAYWREISDEMDGEGWNAANDKLRMALSDPAIWSRDDRHRIFTALEMTDRIREAARTAERLFERYRTASEHTARASRELGARLALQLYGLRQGLDDVRTRAPIDALLRVEPAMDTNGDGADAATSDWCARLEGMYRQWATKRRMKIEDIKPGSGNGTAILHVTGFGAYRTLQTEVGLHVLELPAQDRNGRRIVARVTMVGGPDQALPEAGAFAAATRLLAAAATSATIVRRYREEPAPMVRDLANGWRTGRLDAVLSGDFDIVGAVARHQPTA